MDWQQRYVDGDTPWDEGRPSPSLLYLLENKAVLFSETKEVLVPGCGFGHDVRGLAAHSGRVLGVDISELAILTARELAHGAADFELLDIFDLPAEYHAAFDIVWEHTCFCAIPPEKRAEYVASMWRSLRPSGMVLGVFFVDPERDLDGPPYVLQREEILAEFSSHFVLEWDAPARSSYPGREGREHLFLFRRLADCSE